MITYWTPIRFKYNYDGQKYWEMQCICGIKKDVIYYKYKTFKTTNCGCKRKSKKSTYNLEYKTV